MRRGAGNSQYGYIIRKAQVHGRSLLCTGALWVSYELRLPPRLAYIILLFNLEELVYGNHNASPFRCSVVMTVLKKILDLMHLGAGAKVEMSVEHVS